MHLADVQRHFWGGYAIVGGHIPLAVGIAIGRLGCFAAGCCWGKFTTLPWAVTFTDVYAARAVGTPMDTPLHPSQLYESAAAFLIFAFLLWLAPRKSFHGQVALSYVALYSAVRFGLEFLRDDPRGIFPFLNMPTSQPLALVSSVAAILILATWARRGGNDAGATATQPRRKRRR